MTFCQSLAQFLLDLLKLLLEGEVQHVIISFNEDGSWPAS